MSHRSETPFDNIESSQEYVTLLAEAIAVSLSKVEADIALAGAGIAKTKVALVDLSILQDFGFYYEDEEGQPIDLDEIPKEQRIELYKDAKGKPPYAITELLGWRLAHHVSHGTPIPRT
jgi:hypothetical protein